MGSVLPIVPAQQLVTDSSAELTESTHLVECRDNYLRTYVGFTGRSLTKIIFNSGYLEISGAVFQKIHQDLPSFPLHIVPMFLYDRNEDIASARVEARHDTSGYALSQSDKIQIGHDVERPGSHPTDESQCESVIPRTYAEIITF